MLICASKSVNEAQTLKRCLFSQWTDCSKTHPYTRPCTTAGIHAFLRIQQISLCIKSWWIYYKVASSWQNQGAGRRCMLNLQQRLCRAGSLLPQTTSLLLNWAVVDWYAVSSLALDLVWGLGRFFLGVQVSDVVSHLHTLWQACSPLEQSGPLHVCILPGCKDKSLPTTAMAHCVSVSDSKTARYQGREG